MKKVNFIFALIAMVLAFNIAQASGNGAKAPAAYKVNTEKSSLKWVGKKVTGQHNGAVNISDGQLLVEKGKLVGGNFEIDMTSISVEDLTDKESNQNLTGHLKSDDFFSVEKNPKAAFKITKVATGKDGKTNITGDLTIKGITQNITFPAVVKTTKDQVEATANIVVDRTKFDVRYGSNSFFDNLGDKAIHNDFILDVKLVAGNRNL
jgi:polyisoprenoid-binding protein YceI